MSLLWSGRRPRNVQPVAVAVVYEFPKDAIEIYDRHLAAHEPGLTGGTGNAPLRIKIHRVHNAIL